MRNEDLVEERGDGSSFGKRTELKLPLLAVARALATGMAALVTRITRDTCTDRKPGCKVRRMVGYVCVQVFMMMRMKTH